MKSYDDKMSARVLWAGLGIVAVLFLFNPDVFLLRTGLLAGDYRLWHYPLAALLYRHFHLGTSPLWTELAGCGFPVFAEGQIALLYPFNAVFYKLLPLSLHAAYNCFALFQYWLAGILFFAYVRSLKISYWGAGISTLIYLFGACQGGYFCNSNSQKIAAWFPLILLLVDHFWKTQKHSCFLLIGALIGMQINSGHPQTLVYSAGFALFYYFMQLLWGGGKGIGIRKQAWFAILHLGLIVIIALGIGWPQLAATRELIHFSNRLALPEKFAYVGSLPPQGFLTLLFPFLEKYLGPATLYTGVFGLFLVLLAWLRRRTWSREIWLVFWIGIIAAFFALGEYNPLYIGVIKLTHFYSMRVPSRLVFFSGFAMAVLAGWGWDRLQERPCDETARRLMRWCLIGLALAVLLVLALEPLVRAAAPYLKQWGLELIHRKYTGGLLHPHAPEVYRLKLTNFIRDLTNAVSPWKNPYLLIWILIDMAAIGCLAGLLAGRKNRPLLLMCAGLIAADLGAYHSLGGFRSQLLPFREQAEAVSPWVEYLRKDPGQYRIYEYCTNASRRSLFPLFFNSSIPFGIPDAGIYSPLAPDTHRRYFEGLGANDNSLSLATADPRRFPGLKPLLSLAGVKYALSRTPLPGPGWRECMRSRGFALYENCEVMPRAFWMPETSAREVADFNAYVRGNGFDPGRELILEKPGAVAKLLKNTAGFEAWKPVTVLRRGTEELRIITDQSEPGWLFVGDTDYPGWKAAVNGHAAEIIRANGIFKAVRVPAGKQEAVLSYAPMYGKMLWMPWVVLMLGIGLGLWRILQPACPVK